jgi:[acyl-carrier-protein] S-malonyltransferase
MMFVFPGQGSQHVGMGKEFYERYPECQALLDQEPTIRDLMFTGSLENLSQTHHAQPALFLTSAMMCEVITQKPSCVAGHSLGEYTALYAAGVLSFKDALYLVKRRGEIMFESKGGAMAAILGLDLSEVEGLVAPYGDSCVIANDNCPKQIVISGLESAVEEVSQKASHALKVVRLNVSGAFHSPLMKDAAYKLEKEFAHVSFQSPRCPIIMNITASPVLDPIEIQKNLITQMTGRVRWSESMAHAPTHVIEIGSGKVLTGLMKRINRSIMMRSVNIPEDMEDLCSK